MARGSGVVRGGSRVRSGSGWLEGGTDNSGVEGGLEWLEVALGTGVACDGFGVRGG